MNLIRFLNIFLFISFLSTGCFGQDDSKNQQLEKADENAPKLEKVWSVTPQPLAKINILQFSPDGKLLVTSGSHGPVSLIEVATGKIVSQFPNREEVDVARFSRDSSKVVIEDGEGHLRAFDLKKNAKIANLHEEQPYYYQNYLGQRTKGNELSVTSAPYFISEGQKLLYLAANKVKVFDFNAQQVVREFAFVEGQDANSMDERTIIWETDLSSDEKYLFVRQAHKPDSNGSTLRIVNLETEEVRSLSFANSNVWFDSTVVIPTNKEFAVAFYDHKAEKSVIEIRNIESLEVVQRVEEPSLRRINPLQDLYFSADGSEIRMAFLDHIQVDHEEGKRVGRVIILNRNTGESKTVSGHTEYMQKFTSDGSKLYAMKLYADDENASVTIASLNGDSKSLKLPHRTCSQISSPNGTFLAIGDTWGGVHLIKLDK